MIIHTILDLLSLVVLYCTTLVLVALHPTLAPPIDTYPLAPQLNNRKPAPSLSTPYWRRNPVTGELEACRPVPGRTPREVVEHVMGPATCWDDEDCGDVFGCQGL